MLITKHVPIDLEQTPLTTLVYAMKEGYNIASFKEGCMERLREESLLYSRLLTKPYIVYGVRNKFRIVHGDRPLLDYALRHHRYTEEVVITADLYNSLYSKEYDMDDLIRRDIINTDMSKEEAIRNEILLNLFDGDTDALEQYADFVCGKKDPHVNIKGLSILLEGGHKPYYARLLLNGIKEITDCSMGAFLLFPGDIDFDYLIVHSDSVSS